MSRTRTLDVLFVRSASNRALPLEFRLGTRRERGSESPLGLLQLASYAKYGSRHRISVHDARAPENSSDREIRIAAAVHRPDVAVVWMHPALLADGLEATRAVRHAGCPLVLGTGPLVDSWPEGARRIPELDGLLASRDVERLLAALEVISSSGSARSLAEALSHETSVAPSPECPLDRKLVDYASYSETAPGWPPPQLPPPSRVVGLGTESDKGRFAASRIVMGDMAGTLHPPDRVLEDLGGCDLLGIPWQELRTAPEWPDPDRAWWEELLALLRSRRDAGRTVPSRLRLQVHPRVARSLPLVDLRSLAVQSIDLGDVGAGDPEAVDEAIAAARACRRSGVEPSMTLILGEPGFALSDEERGVRQVEQAGISLDAQLRLHIGSVDGAAWASWLEAPGPDFDPPGLDPDRHRLVLRVRRAHLQKAQDPRRGRAIARRVKDLLGSG